MKLWPDDASIADVTLFDPAFILGPSQITDVYLLGLAVKTGVGWSPSIGAYPRRPCVGQSCGIWSFYSPVRLRK